MHKISEKIIRKFTEVIDVNDWLIETDTGWEPIIDVKETEPYQLWKIILNNGYFLICADDHIVFRDDYSEVFVKDLVVDDLIQTDQGINTITEIIQYDYSEPMYDIGVDSPNHRFYTNGILSHNTTCAAAYLLWYAMFHPDKTVLIAAHKFVGAQEIMMRIRYGYELCPDYIRCGVVNYNKGSMEFDNGSRIVSATTTETTGRGMSVSLLYCLDGETTSVRIRNKLTLVEEDITLKDLYIRLLNPQQVIS